MAGRGLSVGARPASWLVPVVSPGRQRDRGRRAIRARHHLRLRHGREGPQDVEIDRQRRLTTGRHQAERRRHPPSLGRDTARFLLGNLSDFDPATDAVSDAQLLDIDRWILARAGATIDRCRQAYEEYEFHTVYHRLLDL